MLRRLLPPRIVRAAVAFAGLLILSACSQLAAQPEALIGSQVSIPTRVPATHTPAPSATATPAPSNLWIAPDDVRVHPDGGLYSGDTLSFQVQAHNGGDQDLSRVPIAVDWGAGQARAEFFSLPSGGTASTDLLWVWDTGSLIGAQTVTVTVDPLGETGDPDPGNNQVVLQLDLAAGPPAGEIGAHWRTSSSACCTFHFVSGTAAERDLAALTQAANDAIRFDEERLGVTHTDKLDVYLIDRVLGHGGFAGDVITISYLDRNYAGDGLPEVFRHEGVHLLDRLIAHGDRPVMLVEGFAVYITGGHFKIEPLSERAAALLQLDAYIPLRELTNNF